jgi:hypothetical protein
LALYSVEISSGSGRHITVNCEGSQTIDGVSSVSIITAYGIIKVISEGGSWFTL